jgi:hypothetical protein
MSDAETQPLRIYIRETSNRDKMWLEVNEFNVLLNHLPMASVCSESRSHAAVLCRGQVKLMHLIYSSEELANTNNDIQEILEPIFAQPEAVMVTSGRLFPEPQCPIDKLVKFDSAEHLVGVIDRVFGTFTQRLILDPWHQSYNTLRGLYWPHEEQTRTHEDSCLSGLSSPFQVLIPRQVAFHLRTRRWIAFPSLELVCDFYTIQLPISLFGSVD